MAVFRHPETGLLLGDSERIPLQTISSAELEEQLAIALPTLILSASGWRTVFAASGNEEDSTEQVSNAHQLIASAAGIVFAEYVTKRIGHPPTIILGQDSRPTGTILSECIIRALLAKGCQVHYAFIIAAPEIMAYAREAGQLPPEDKLHADGFMYISASHNPVGHNGIKFGLTDGGVLPASEAAKLIESFFNLLGQNRHNTTIPQSSAAQCAGLPLQNNLVRQGIEQIQQLVKLPESTKIHEIYTQSPIIKQKAYEAYNRFTRLVICGSDVPSVQDSIFTFIRETNRLSNLGILIDYNGSARTTSIDRTFLEQLGCSIRVMNEKPRQIAHRIVPEGESLDPCRLQLAALHQEDSRYIVGYVPDCDGDRGNLVIWDDALQSTRALEAQEIFALCCVAELAHMVWTGELRYDKKGNAIDKVAIAINDPTSMRIARIASAFDVSVFRAEVGEANVVGLARRLREQGYKVRFLGEGAAGGNITHPSAVRDPIDTIGAILKLLTIRSHGERMGLFELWCELSSQAEAYHEDFTLANILATLPNFITTSSYSPEAILKIKTTDHSILKERFQQVFLQEWEQRKEGLAKQYGITQWEALAYSTFRRSRQGRLKNFVPKQSEHPVSIHLDARLRDRTGF
ncbi:MAG: phosphatidylglycerol lysyltransferase [Termitinemataceae bacterium]